MKHARDIKRIILVLGVSALFALILLFIISMAFSYRKAQNVEQLINNFKSNELVAQGLNLSVKNEKFICRSNKLTFLSSQIICEAYDANLSFSLIPIASASSIIIESETPALKTSIPEILENLNVRVKLSGINFPKEILGEPQFVDENITALFKKKVLPQLQDLNATFSYSQKHFNKAGSSAPIQISLNINNASALLSFNLNNFIDFYKQPIEVNFKTKRGERKVSLLNQAFFDNAKVCLSITDRESLMNAFYGYYQTQYLLARDKEKLNDYYLDIQDDKIVSLSDFQKKMSELLDIAVKEQNKVSETEFMARDNASIIEMFFPFLQSFFKGKNEMCQTLSAPQNTPFSLTQMNYRLQTEGEGALDEMLSDLNTTFTSKE